jgi:hypothetical protein
MSPEDTVENVHTPMMCVISWSVRRVMWRDISMCMVGSFLIPLKFVVNDSVFTAMWSHLSWHELLYFSDMFIINHWKSKIFCGVISAHVASSVHIAWLGVINCSLSIQRHYCIDLCEWWLGIHQVPMVTTVVNVSVRWSQLEMCGW